MVIVKLIVCENLVGIKIEVFRSIGLSEATQSQTCNFLNSFYVISRQGHTPSEIRGRDITQVVKNRLTIEQKRLVFAIL